MVEVNQPHPHTRRRRGKTDAIDAELAARHALAHHKPVRPKQTTGLRMLRLADVPDPHPHVPEFLAPPEPTGDGALRGSTPALEVPGDHTLLFRVTGVGPSSGAFTRQAQRSFRVVAGR